MKVTIVMEDELVIVEGVAYKVDLRDLPPYLHAIQWNGSYGELEFRADKATGKKLPNISFTDFSPFEYLVGRWRVQKAHAEIKLQEQKAMAEAQAAVREQQRSQKVM